MHNIIVAFLFIVLSLWTNKTIVAQSDISTLIQAMLDDSPMEADLQYICDAIGGRVTGSAANETAVDWTYERFKSAGLSVEKDTFSMPSLWLAEYTKMNLTGDQSFDVQAVSKYKTPPGKYQGNVVYLGLGTDKDFEGYPQDLSNSFVLVESELCLDINGLFEEYTNAAIAEFNARKRGAKGIIFMSSRPKGLLYRFITAKTADNAMPQFVMAREDAKRCIRLIENGSKLDVTIEVNASIGEAFQSENVIAEIKGSEKPEEIIIIGAHIDSWALGTGANDNACNVSMMIDIARQMTRLGIKPKRTIRFALWNGEEQGYFGSWHYTKENIDELDNHKMALSVDIGSGPIIGFFTNGRDELIPILDSVLLSVDTLGQYLNINAPIVGTDNFDFMLQGVPNLVANHKPSVYGINYHASSDTYDKVDLESLNTNSAIIAALTLSFANMSNQEAELLNRQNRAQVQDIFDKHSLEFTMRMFNVWDPWVTGQRGIN